MTVLDTAEGRTSRGPVLPARKRKARTCVHRSPGGLRMSRTKRAYEPPADTDGTRVLVDRLWPR